MLVLALLLRCVGKSWEAKISTNRVFSFCILSLPVQFLHLFIPWIMDFFVFRGGVSVLESLTGLLAMLGYGFARSSLV